MKRFTIPIIIITILLATSACSQSSTPTKVPPVEIQLEEEGKVPTGEAFVPESTETEEAIEKVDLAPPLIQGDIDIFKNDSEQWMIISRVLKFQEILNNYDQDSSQTLTEYINIVKRHLPKDENYMSMFGALKMVENFGELSDIELAQILQKMLPELNIVNLEDWPERAVDFVVFGPRSSWPVFQPGFRTGLQIYVNEEDENAEVLALRAVGDYPISYNIQGDMLLAIDQYVNIDQSYDIDMYTTIAKAILGEATSLCTATMNEDKKLEIVVIDDSNSNEFLGETYRSFVGHKQR